MSSLAPWVALGSLTLPAAAPPPLVKVRSLEFQTREKVTYFRATVDAPADLDKPNVRARLVALDNQTRDTYVADPSEASPGGGRTLLIRGIREGEEKASCVQLQYVVPRAGVPPFYEKRTVELHLDWANAKPHRIGKEGEDFNKAWEAGLNSRGEQVGLYWPRERSQPANAVTTLIEDLRARKAKTRSGPQHLNRDAAGAGGLLRSFLPETARIYEMTTGATALTETLALNRVWQGGRDNKPVRDVDGNKLAGIDVPEHPWAKMMGDKRPAAEPLARLVPHDNWYLTMTSPAAFLAAWEVLDTWGGSVLRPPTVHDRDHGTRARYEAQLCLPSADVVRELPAGVVGALALTGSGLFWTEGSDLTLLAEVKDVERFHKLHDVFVAQARARHGKALKEGKQTYRGHDVASFVTPRREVSLHRATIGNVIVCSNSPIAIRHVLDVHTTGRKPLADSLDFQYMRTVFVRDGKDEDGFAFLSDAFVRRLVSPTTRIRESRRQEARAGLLLASAAALFVGQETGKPPPNTDALVKEAGLTADDLALPEGKPAAWDGSATQAVSEVYNTLAFTTPLVELPLDRVTRDEEAAYNRFRDEYLRLWRRFFDPVGIRFRMQPKATRIEVYLLPLVNNREYNALRQWVGGGTVRYSPSRIPPTTALRIVARLPVDTWLKDTGIGDWGMLHIDADGLDLEPLVRDALLAERKYTNSWATDLPRLPLLLATGVGDKDKLGKLAEQLSGVSSMKLYRGQLVFEHNLDLGLLGASQRPTLYSTRSERAQAMSLGNRLLERWIDQQIDGTKTKPKDEVETNISLYLAPPGSKNLDALSAVFEWETHKQALSAASLWQPLYASGFVTSRMSESDRAATARRLLGYVPASPDRTAFAYDPARQEVTNARHGSFAHPTYRGTLAPGADVLKLLSQLRSLRADLRFREDGIHTTLTLDWK